MAQRILGERYATEEKIGSGGMAEVYIAHDNLLDRKVAVKILHEAYRSDMQFIERFHREAKAAAKLSHPNIVSIYDVGVDNDDHYIVMEYVPGHSLKDKIREEGALKISDAVTISKDIASGLAHAHLNNLVHCDIKPHNILMTADGHAKIADFGIARAVTESTMTYSGNVIGSVHYFSPEQAQGGTITPKSDVYSLGVVMYEMLTNRLPFTGDNAVAIAMKHIEEEPTPPSVFRSQIPPMLEAITLRAMSKNPEMRPTAFELIQVISTITTAPTNEISAKDPDATQFLPRSKSKHFSTQKNSNNDSPIKAAEKSFMKSKLFMFGLVLVLIFGFGMGTFMAFGKFWSSEEVPVPDVKGKQLALARQILEDGKLRVNVAETYDANVPAGQVVSQDPDPGRSVKADRLVTIYVSKGGEAIEMPDLVGLTKSAATERLQKMGLNLGSTYEKESSSEPGTVLSHDPSAGTKIVRGQNIDLVVSRGESEKSKSEEKDSSDKISVPDVHNASFEVARDGIEGRGLNVGSVTYEISSQAAGTVVSQSPSPGAEVSAGSYVDLIIATREETHSEPQETYHEPEVQVYSEPSQSETYQPEPTPEEEIIPSREDNSAKSR
ncbi:MAG: Stk1 family PASTA domain-containing Ser/Thr kinase [Selenomonadaceae bacterium]|nr:Stk1 family PASTA domain-containing Ser/Thr kinase [Selenomonadaceae bacterium]